MKRGFLICAVVAGVLWGAAAAGIQNFLQNGDFEGELAPAWEMRTLPDATRKIARLDGQGRSGAGVVLENLEPTFTRVRQGHAKEIEIADGSTVEFSAWAKSTMGPAAKTTLQIYCMDAQDKIVAQPLSRPEIGAFEWKRMRMLVRIPKGTAYVMAYLQTCDDRGAIYFDDARLALKLPPPVAVVAPKIVMLTDLPTNHHLYVNARALFDGLVVGSGSDAKLFEDAKGALALYRGKMPSEVWPLLKGYAERGGRVFMDIRAFAACHESEAVEVQFGTSSKSSMAARMGAGLRVTAESAATAGFAVGQVMPRTHAQSGKLMVLPKGFSRAGVKTLAQAPDGEAGLVEWRVGKGVVTACDLLGMAEPYCRLIECYYAFTPVSGALGNPVRFGRYFPKRFTYAELIDEMRRVAREFPSLQVEDEGEASTGEHLWSLNIGNKDGPLYFMYAAAHGSEWEAGYGLITFAQRLAEGRMNDVVDLSKVRIKMLPILNPFGYTNFKRQNKNGVDLNRQGAILWEHFKGRDSNNDGVFGPFDYDWKGTAPFDELEARVYKRIIDDPKLFAILDYHGNTSARSNKLAILPLEADERNEELAWQTQNIINERLSGRHLLRQSDEEGASQYLLDRMVMNGGTPVLMNTSARGKFGMLIEVTSGYRESYGTVLQSDVVCEMCRAFLQVYKP